MSSLSAAVPAVMVGCLIFVLALQARLVAQIRERLRGQAESLVIRKRWLEHRAASPRQFTRDWEAELRALHAAHVPERWRRLVSLRDVRWAVDAEFAGLLTAEIECWTRIDRTCRTPETFEAAIRRRLEAYGWQVQLLARDRRLGAHLIVTQGRRRATVLCHDATSAVACRTVQEAARASLREACGTACIVASGGFHGAARVLAEGAGVALLHNSELDRLAAFAARPPAPLPWADLGRRAA